MKIIENLIQCSNEWLEFRKSHVGASESAAILGVSPYKTPLDVFNEKTNRSFLEPMNDAMRLGTEMEPKIRKEWERLTGKIFDTPTAEHDDYPYISASFDGYCHEDNSIIECKFSRHPKLANCIKKHDIEYFKEIYKHYWVQCQHLMFVSEAKECTLITICPEGELLDLALPRDNDFIEKKMVPSLVTFIHEYILKDEEPALTDGDYLYIDDTESISLAKEWHELNQRIKMLQDLEKEKKAALIQKGDDGNIIVGNILKMTRYATTRTNYKKACEDNDIDLSIYKTLSIGHYRLTPIT